MQPNTKAGNIMPVKISDEERAVMRQLGKRARAETEKRIGKRKLVAIAKAQGHHGIEGGRPALYPTCMTAGKRNPRHRFYKGTCSKCGIPQQSE
jgi:hypothetical protein